MCNIRCQNALFANQRFSPVQGVMKRHNFPGLPASHGVSKAHRSGGSTGQRDAPGRVSSFTNL